MKIFYPPNISLSGANIIDNFLTIPTQVPISGTYYLVRVDDNYKDYLLAMEIPQTAVDILAIS